MIDRVVTLTGPPGSGKTTAGRAVASRLGLEFRSAGELFRAEADRLGLSLEAFSRHAETHPEVDRALDDRMIALGEPGRLLEGRITGALLRRRGRPCVVLRVTARPDVRYRRLAERDGIPVPEAIARTKAREESERDRYRRYYGIEVDTEPADFGVDSSDIGPPVVVERLLLFLRPFSAPPAP